MGYLINLFSFSTYLKLFGLLAAVYSLLLGYYLLSVRMKKKDYRARPEIPGEIIKLRLCTLTYWVSAVILTVFPIYIAVPLWVGGYFLLCYSPVVARLMDAADHFTKATRYDPHPYRVVWQYLRLNKVIDRRYNDVSYPYFGSGGVAVFAFVAWLYGTTVYPKPLEAIANNLYLITVFFAYFLVFLLPRKTISAIVQPIIFLIALIILNLTIFW
jgi:hypothetical protein